MNEKRIIEEQIKMSSKHVKTYSNRLVAKNRNKIEIQIALFV